MKNNITTEPNVRFSRGENVIFTDVDDEIVLMSIENGKYYGLDDIGSSIWRKLIQPCLLSELIDDLMTKYDADEQTCRDEVLKFLDSMLEKNLIRSLM